MKTKDAIAMCEDLLDWLKTLQRDSSDIDALTTVLTKLREYQELEVAARQVLDRAAEFASQYDDGDNAANRLLTNIDDVIARHFQVVKEKQ